MNIPPMRSVKEYRIQAVLLAAIVLTAALLSQRVYVRFDMTKQHTYSLSSYTRSILNSLEGTVTVTWFRSYNIEGYLPSLQYVEDILAEYERASDGRCLVLYRDTEELSPQQLQQLGIIARQIERNSNNTQILQNLYSGLLCEYRGESRVVPFLSDIYTLEADIARFITEMNQDAQGRSTDRSIYVALPDGGAEGEYQYVLPWLEYAGFIPIMLTKPYPELHPEIPLLVIGSSYFDADMLTAVDTFVNRHGSAAFFVSANTVDTGGSWQATPKQNDGLIELLARSGFAVQPNLVMDPVNFRMTLPASGGGTYEHINYPFWLQVFRQETDSIPPLLAAGKAVQFFWPSELVCTAARGKTPTPLLASSSRSALQNPPYDTDPHGAQLAEAANGDHEAYPLAAFSERGVNAVSGIGSADNARLLVVADEYCVSSAVEYTNSDANLDFMVNTVYWLARQDALLQLKNKQPAVLPFRYFESDAAFNRIITVSRIVNLVLVPLLIIAAGAALYVIRRRKRP
jgi:hypothetical protein